MNQLLVDALELLDAGVTKSLVDTDEGLGANRARRTARIVSPSVYRFASAFVCLSSSCANSLLPSESSSKFADVNCRFFSFLRAAVDASGDLSWLLFSVQSVVGVLTVLSSVFSQLLPDAIALLLSCVQKSAPANSSELSTVLALFARACTLAPGPIVVSERLMSLLTHIDLMTLRAHPEPAVRGALAGLYAQLARSECGGHSERTPPRFLLSLCEEACALLSALDPSVPSVQLVSFNMMVLSQLRFYDHLHPAVSALLAVALDKLDAALVALPGFTSFSQSFQLLAFASLITLSKFQKYSLSPGFVKVASSLLSSSSASSRATVVRALTDFKSNLVELAPSVFSGLLRALDDPEDSVRHLAATFFGSAIGSRFSLTGQQYSSILRGALRHCSDRAPSVVHLSLLAASDAALPSPLSREVGRGDSAKMDLARSIQLRDAWCGTAKSPEITKFLSWLLFLHGHADTTADELRRRFYSAPESSQLSGDLSMDLLLFWVISDVVHSFLSNRLRTTYGSAAQSLEVVERALLRAVSPDPNFHRPFEALRLLFQFVDSLDRGIVFAMEGSCVLGPCALSAATQSFFRANRKVCADWMNRMRPKLGGLAFTSGLHIDSLRHGLERLSYLARYACSATATSVDPLVLRKEVEQCLVQVSSSLVELRDADFLEGLARWAKPAFKSRVISADLRFQVELRWLFPLIQMCKGRYERAADLFSSFLHKISLEDRPLLRDSGVLQFVFDCANTCYVRVADWEAQSAWAAGIEGVEVEDAKFRYSAAFTQALIDFDCGDYGAILEKLPFRPGPSAAVDIRSCVGWSEELMLSAMAALASNKMSNEFVESSLREAHSLLLPILCCLPNDPDLARPALVQLQALRQVADLVTSSPPFSHGPPPLPALFDEIPRVDAARLEVGNWTSLLRINRLRMHLALPKCGSPQQIMKLARKTLNFRLAERLSQDFQLSAHDETAVAFERAKLLIALNKPAQAIIQVWNLTRSLLSSAAQTPATIHLFLKLSRWLQQFGKQSEVVEQLSYFISPLAGSARGSQPVDAVIGSCLREATEVSASNSTAWFRYADWLYRNGRRISKSFLLSNPAGSSLVLSPGEKSRLELLLGRCSRLKTDDQRKQALSTLLTDVLPRAAFENAEDSLAQTPQIRDEAVMKSFSTAIAVEDGGLAQEFLSVFSDVRKRILSHHRLALDSYLKFLQLNEQPTSREPGITATLRVLRLLARFGSELSFSDSAKGSITLAEKLDLLPVSPWRDVVPQLFARLGHPDSFVQAQVLRLIRNLGKVYPQDVTYALFAGSAVGPDAVAAIRDAVLGHSRDLFLQLELFVVELRQLAVLAEESVLSSLRELLTDVTSRLRTIKGEVSRGGLASTEPTSGRVSLSESYSTIMKPAISRFDRLVRDISKYQFSSYSSSSAPTKHDQWFVATYRDQLNYALHVLRTLPAQLADFELVVHPLRALIKDLSTCTHRSSLRLDAISNRLGKGDISVPVPGSTTEGVSIFSIDQSVVVLPTKTKPKKITMKATNGLSYIFLLKGREDLHLDERIMQLLASMNDVLRRDKSSESRGLRARTYGVTPLGRTGGLIQWVNGSVPMYHVVSEHQRRTSAASRGSDTGVEEKKSSKPLDLFYAKLMPALAAAGLPQSNFLSHDRSLGVLKKVFLELEREAPKELLERELVLSCATTSEWWHKTSVFARSAAVSSMVGYIIGLGDRHLDNILVDFSTGELVHIDYNVCFEKGLKLRIPEVVPFRLTQIIQRALGVTGVEGTFRSAAECSLSVLRQHREVLLTLLEAFVFDPVVDWTTSDKLHEEERSMELDVAFTLLLTRTGSIDAPSAELRMFHVACAQLEETIPVVLDDVQPLLSGISSASAVLQTKLLASTQRSQLSHNLQSIVEEIVNANSDLKDALRDLEESSEARLQAGSALSAVVDEQARESENVDSLYIQTFSTTTTKELDRALPSPEFPRTLESRSVLSTLKLSESFIARCVEKDQEMFRLITGRDELLSQLVGDLKEYQALVLAACPVVDYISSSTASQLLTEAKSMLAPSETGVSSLLDEEHLVAQAAADYAIFHHLDTKYSLAANRLALLKGAVVSLLAQEEEALAFAAVRRGEFSRALELQELPVRGANV